MSILHVNCIGKEDEKFNHASVFSVKQIHYIKNIQPLHKNFSAAQTDTHHVPQTDPNSFSTIYNHCITFCMVEKLFKICSIKNNSTINQDFMPNLFFIFYFIEKIRILNEFIFENMITNNKFVLLKIKFNIKKNWCFEQPI